MKEYLDGLFGFIKMLPIIVVVLGLVCLAIYSPIFLLDKITKKYPHQSEVFIYRFISIFFASLICLLLYDIFYSTPIDEAENSINAYRGEWVKVPREFVGIEKFKGVVDDFVLDKGYWFNKKTKKVMVFDNPSIKFNDKGEIE